MFEILTPDTGNLELNGERRIYFMATRPNRESTLVWRKSSRSGANGGCVQVALADSSVLVKDSRGRSEAILEFSPAQWSRFVRRINNGTLAVG
jgi:Domain of unknown function (DUF397)